MKFHLNQQLIILMHLLLIQLCISLGGACRISGLALVYGFTVANIISLIDHFSSGGNFSVIRDFIRRDLTFFLGFFMGRSYIIYMLLDLNNMIRKL